MVIIRHARFIHQECHACVLIPKAVVEVSDHTPPTDNCGAYLKTRSAVDEFATVAVVHQRIVRLAPPAAKGWCGPGMEIPEGDIIKVAGCPRTIQFNVSCNATRAEGKMTRAYQCKTHIQSCVRGALLCAPANAEPYGVSRPGPRPRTSQERITMRAGIP